jgi:DNA polymerase III alpha subunit
LNYSKDFQKNQSSNQASLFGGSELGIKMPEISLEPAEPAPKMTRLGWEKELLGLYVSDHPLAEFLDFFRQFSTPISQINANLINNTVTVGGIIDKVKKIFLKSQKSMAFASFEDAEGQKMEAIVFPKTLERYGALWEEGKIVLITGKISDKDGTLKILADEARLVNQDEIDRYGVLEQQRKKDDVQRQNEQKLYITLPPNASSELLRQISSVLSSAPAGDCKVFLELSQGRLETPYRIGYDVSISNKLKNIIPDIKIRLF